MNKDKEQAPDFEVIKKAKDSLDNLSIFQIHLGDQNQLLLILQNFIRQAVDWTNLIRRSPDHIRDLIKRDFDDFASSLDKFKEFCKSHLLNEIERVKSTNKEEKYRAEQSSMLPFITQINNSAFNCYITLITVLMSKENENPNDFRGYSTDLFNSVGNCLDHNILWAKLNYLKHDLIVEYTQEIELIELHKKLKEHFYLFIAKAQKKYPYLLHSLLQNEICLALNHFNQINSNQIDEFFKLFIVSSQCFSQLMDKNDYYFKIERALKQEYIFLNNLQDDLPKLEGFEAEIKITETSHLSIKNLIYRIAHNGLIEMSRNDELIDFNKRSNNDCLVVVGKKDCINFNFDIQLNFQSSEPNDDIAALIFLNRNGLNIIDMSKKYAIQLYQTRTEINDQKVFVMGKKHLFWIEECKGIMFKNKKTMTIIFHCFDNCAATKDIDGYLFHLLPGQKIHIGRRFENDLTLRDDEIKESHAEIELTSEGKLRMTDLSMGHTSFLLKTRRRIEKRKTSCIKQLVEFPRFGIHNFKFECKHLRTMFRR